jgi:hypothetical protein
MCIAVCRDQPDRRRCIMGFVVIWKLWNWRWRLSDGRRF